MRFKYLDWNDREINRRPTGTVDVIFDITTSESGIENRIAAIENMLAGLIEETLVTEQRVAEFLTKYCYNRVVPYKEQ